MTYTGLEMTAIVKLANAMILADGKIEKSETTALAMELDKFGVSLGNLKSILAASDKLDYGYAIAIISAMNVGKKKYVTGLLAVIMASDGDIADSEIKTWQLVSTLAGLPTMTITEALEFWKNN